MRTHRRSLVSTPSEKSLSHATQTQDSQVDTSIGFYVPGQNHYCSQRRFTRKNGNCSQEKSKNRTVTQVEHDNSMSSINRNLQIPKLSKQKPSPSYVKVPLKPPNSTSNPIHPRTGSFTLSRTRQTRLSNLQDTIRISEQKYTSRQSGKSSDSYASKCGAKSNNIAVLRTQLELKEKELMVMEDQRRRFRNSLEDMRRKEVVLLGQIGKYQEEARKMKQNFKQNITDLQKKLQQISTYSKKLQLDLQSSKTLLLQSQKQKKILQKQLSLFINRQLPKNIRDFQSCRQISLEQTIQDLKAELRKDRGDREKELEDVVDGLREDVQGLRAQLRVLGIRGRLMDKRAVDSQRYLEAYTSMKQQYKSVRSKLKSVDQQCELLRTQNIKLKKQLKKLNTTLTSYKKSAERAKKQNHKQNDPQRERQGNGNSCNGNGKRVCTQQDLESSRVSERSVNLSLSNCSV